MRGKFGPAGLQLAQRGWRRPSAVSPPAHQTPSVSSLEGGTSAFASRERSGPAQRPPGARLSRLPSRGGADRQALGRGDHLGAVGAPPLLRRAVADRARPLRPAAVAPPARARGRGHGQALRPRRDAPAGLLCADGEGTGPAPGDPGAPLLGAATGTATERLPQDRRARGRYQSRGFPAGIRSRTSTPSTTSTGWGSVVSRNRSSWPGPSDSNAASTVRGVRGEDHGARWRRLGVVGGLGGEREHAVEARLVRSSDLRGDLDSVVADLAHREAVELVLGDLDQHPVGAGAGFAARR